jgi:hypothetical protein
MRPSFALAAIAIAVLAAPATGRAHWYAQLDRPGHVGACLQVEDSIDDVLANLNEGFAKAAPGRNITCTVNSSGGNGLIGFLVECGEGGEHFFFRTRANCEKYQATSNAGGQIRVEDFAPTGVEQRARWMAAYGICMDAWANADSIRRGVMQATATMCECMAGRLVTSKTELSESQVSSAVQACLDAVPAGTREKIARPAPAPVPQKATPGAPASAPSPAPSPAPAAKN